MSLVGTVLRFIKDKVDVVINFIRSLMFSQNAVQLNFTLGQSATAPVSKRGVSIT